MVNIMGFEGHIWFLSLISLWFVCVCVLYNPLKIRRKILSS